MASGSVRSERPSARRLVDDGERRGAVGLHDLRARRRGLHEEILVPLVADEVHQRAHGLVRHLVGGQARRREKPPRLLGRGFAQPAGEYRLVAAGREAVDDRARGIQAVGHRGRAVHDQDRVGVRLFEQRLQRAGIAAARARRRGCPPDWRATRRTATAHRAARSCRARARRARRHGLRARRWRARRRRRHW